MQEGTRFASSGDDVKIWDSLSLTVVEQFNPHSPSHPVSSICWASNNRYLATASAAGDKIVISSCKSKPVPLCEVAEGGKQTCVNLNSSSSYAVSGGLDKTVNIWDVKSRKLYRSLKDHKDEVTCVTYNGNDCYIASGSLSGEIILHSVTTNLSSTPFGYGSSQIPSAVCNDSSPPGCSCASHRSAFWVKNQAADDDWDDDEKQKEWRSELEGRQRSEGENESR